MAQRVNIVLVDDIDGGEADETVTFSIDGAAYEIDLSAKNAQKLRDLLAPYVGHGRRANGTTRRRSSRPASGPAVGGPAAADVREWARKNGWKDLGDRGRIPAEVREAYDAAH